MKQVDPDRLIDVADMILRTMDDGKTTDATAELLLSRPIKANADECREAAMFLHRLGLCENKRTFAARKK